MASPGNVYDIYCLIYTKQNKIFDLNHGKRAWVGHIDSIAGCTMSSMTFDNTQKCSLSPWFSGKCLQCQREHRLEWGVKYVRHLLHLQESNGYPIQMTLLIICWIKFSYKDVIIWNGILNLNLSHLIDLWLPQVIYIIKQVSYSFYLSRIKGCYYCGKIDQKAWRMVNWTGNSCVQIGIDWKKLISKEVIHFGHVMPRLTLVQLRPACEILQISFIQ